MLGTRQSTRWLCATIGTSANRHSSACSKQFRLSWSCLIASGSSFRPNNTSSSYMATSAALCRLQHCHTRSEHRHAKCTQTDISPDSEDPSYLACTIPAVSGEEAEALSDVLLGYGAQSVVVEEYRPEGAPEQEIFDDGTQQLWSSCTVVANFPDQFDLTEALEVARAVVGGRELGQVVQRLVPVGWVEAVKASYVPLKVVEGVWILPEWSSPQEEGALNIVLQPGVAFGTGEHPTTRLCLKALMEMPLEGLSVCDYGSGSGVLALGALLRGAASAVGVDVDPLAVRAAARNAELSGVADRFQSLQCGPSLQDPDPLAQVGGAPRQFDLVVANILRGPLLELAPRLAGYTRPGGRLMLSGILEQQVPDVLEAYKASFHSFQVASDSSWALVTATRS